MRNHLAPLNLGSGHCWSSRQHTVQPQLQGLLVEDAQNPMHLSVINVKVSAQKNAQEVWHRLQQ